MCGIAGVLQASSPVEDGVLACLEHALHHRGPDDRGTFVSADGCAGLVHTRLSILDLSAAGRQPMHSPDGRYAITFNGEIYNFRELRCELQRKGETFCTGTDTEVLLRLYSKHGPACVERLRGMFAFAIWDARERSCFLARDHFGIKPLYYHPAGDRLVFASELKALLRANLVPRRLDPDGVAGYFRTGSVPEPHTLIQDVRCLRAGHAMLWKEGKGLEYGYRSPRLAREPKAGGDAVVETVRTALQDTVEHHFLSDVPVGIFLSGGIDSTALLALARSGPRNDVRTFCIRFPEREFDEGSLARRTAAHLGSIHEEMEVDAAKGRTLFKDFLSHLDQPSIDGFNTFVVSKFAHDQGMKVVLSGLGGDELFGGYPSFRQIPRLIDASRRLRKAGPFADAAGAALERFAPKEPWRRLGHFLRAEPSVLAAYQAYRAIFLPRDARQLTLGYTGSLGAAWQSPPPIDEPTVADEVSAYELSLYMRNQLLRDSDVMSMSWGLELRTPFVDVDLVSSIAAIPASIRLQPGKKLLLDAVPEIPDWIRRHPKQGFVFPFKQWFDADWDELFRETSSTHGVRSRTWYQKWAIFVFEHWRREHGVN